MYLDLTQFFYDVNHGVLTEEPLSVKKRMGNFKMTIGKRIKNIEIKTGENLLFSKGKGIHAKTYLDMRLVGYLCMYIKNIDIESKLLFDEEIMNKYIIVEEKVVTKI